MDQPNSGIGNVTTNTGLVEMAMAYSRSRVLCAAARLGVADALGDEVRNVGFMAEKCQADANGLYSPLRALASIGVTEETTPEHFRLTPFGKLLRRDVPESVWSAVVFWADLLAEPRAGRSHPAFTRNSTPISEAPPMSFFLLMLSDFIEVPKMALCFPSRCRTIETDRLSGRQCGNASTPSTNRPSPRHRRRAQNKASRLQHDRRVVR